MHQVSQELEPVLRKEAIVVVAAAERASTSGEINVPIQEGIYSTGEIYRTLAKLVVGNKKGGRTAR
ncbi:MAG: hypothetical protein ACUVTR_04920 [Dehalococcoidia bacterium]